MQDDGRMYPVTSGSAAPALESLPESRPERPTAGPQLVMTPPAARSAEPRSAYQASLFGPQELRPATPKPKAPAHHAPRVRRERPEQARFDFEETTSGARALKTSVEAAIYCDAPVAIASHRATAAVIDTLLGLAGVGVLAATAHYGGADVEFSSANAPYYVAATALVLIFYRVLFCLGNGDTPGMRAAGLQLINFDGHRPTRKQRWQRFWGGIVSASSAGLGLLWALFEEEQLTWHDLMSKTFPTEAAQYEPRGRR